MKILSNNKKAKFDYFLSNDLEAGIVLTGAEVKSIRDGQISLKESYVKIINNEVWLIGATITDSSQYSSYSKFDGRRDKKLLLSKKQINKYNKLTQERGTTLIMQNIYLNDKGMIKCTVCVGTGKQTHDKRNVIKQRDLDRANGL